MSQSAVLDPGRRSRPGSRRERSALGRVRPGARMAALPIPTRARSPARRPRSTRASWARSKAVLTRLRALPERFQSLTAGQKARREKLRGSAARLRGLGPRRKASTPPLGASRSGEPARRKAGDAARPPAPSPRPVRRDGTRCNEPLKFLPFTLRSLPKDSDDGAVENRLRACASAPTLDISVPCFAAVLDSTRACTS